MMFGTRMFAGGMRVSPRVEAVTCSDAPCQRSMMVVATQAARYTLMPFSA